MKIVDYRNVYIQRKLEAERREMRIEKFYDFALRISELFVVIFYSYVFIALTMGEFSCHLK